MLEYLGSFDIKLHCCSTQSWQYSHTAVQTRVSYFTLALWGDSILYMMSENILNCTLKRKSMSGSIFSHCFFFFSWKPLDIQPNNLFLSWMYLYLCSRSILLLQGKFCTVSHPIVYRPSWIHCHLFDPLNLGAHFQYAVCKKFNFQCIFIIINL